MILETKVGLALGVVAVVGVVGAWASDAVVTIVQTASGILEDETVRYVLASVAMIGVAWGVMRNEVRRLRDDHATAVRTEKDERQKLAHRFDTFERSLNDLVVSFKEFAARSTERMNNHSDEIRRLRDTPSGRKPRREPTSDPEEV